MIRRISNVDNATAQLIERLGPQFIELGVVNAGFNAEWFLPNWDKILRSGLGAMWVGFKGDEDIGILGALLHPCLFTGQVIATESFWFVDPNHRGGSTGVRLFLEFLGWSKQVGAERVQAGRIVGSMGEELEAFYMKHGFKKLETLYVKEH
jgi:GNAT superfamily N-acetyltransferase